MADNIVAALLGTIAQAKLESTGWVINCPALAKRRLERGTRLKKQVPPLGLKPWVGMTVLGKPARMASEWRMANSEKRPEF